MVIPLVWYSARRWFTVSNAGNYHNLLFLIVSLDSGIFVGLYSLCPMKCPELRRQGSQVVLTACDFVEGHDLPGN